MALREPGFKALRLPRGIEPGQQALCAGFLITRCAVDLSCKIQAPERPGFQCRLEVARIEVVVFDRVTRLRDLRVLEPGHRTHERFLRLEWQARRDTVWIHDVGSKALGLDKHLV